MDPTSSKGEGRKLLRAHVNSEPLAEHEVPVDFALGGEKSGEGNQSTASGERRRTRLIIGNVKQPSDDECREENHSMLRTLFVL